MNETVWIAALIAVGLVAGRISLPGWAGWVVLLGLVAGADGVLAVADPIVRMVGICLVLLAAMKGVVYRAWGGRLSWPCYLIFSLAWFGMDPGSFARRRVDLSWRADVGWGLGLMVVGTAGAMLVWAMDWRQILVMFVPMSLGFHFGALRVLKGGLRRAGFPVRTLFPNLLKAKGVGDFWNRRWNVGYSQMMQRVVGRPAGRLLGRRAGTFAVFMVSGLLHELAITVPVRAGYGLPTAYFVGHGLMVLLEEKSGRSFGKFPALFAVAVPLGLLFPPAFQKEVVARSLHFFDLIL